MRCVLFHFVVLSTVLFSSAYSSYFAATSSGAGRGASRRDGKGCGGTGRGTGGLRGQETDKEGLRVMGRAAERGKTGRPVEKDEAGNEGGAERDNHWVGGGLPGMDK